MEVEDQTGLKPDPNRYRVEGNGPTDGTDPTGLDIVVLEEDKASVASGLGHLAILIGDDKKGWTYYSFENTKSEDGTYVHTYDFDTLKDARSSNLLKDYSHYALWHGSERDDTVAKRVPARKGKEVFDGIHNNCQMMALGCSARSWGGTISSTPTGGAHNNIQAAAKGGEPG